uniref:Methyltransferase FkbM domain-containing protein n=1 Tax=Prymnesium polylepis TaxID=72548 RepID=A0A7S4JBJ2_9EUKA|mmetsp:Transcript_41655/g.103644  ORF Transcript_41655/g.103644 Transcript_41655/m.103644 type:complete len:222 (+) Transcript_41655:634-1299(+)
MGSHKGSRLQRAVGWGTPREQCRVCAAPVATERHLNWTGVLVEPNRCGRCYLPLNRPRSRHFWGGICPSQRHIQVPNTFTLACRSTTASPEKSDACMKSRSTTGSRVPCQPISDILASMGVSSLDFLSLDVQTDDLMALRSIDFGALNISTLLVECFSPACERHLQEHGYATLKLTRVEDGLRSYFGDVLAWKPEAWAQTICTANASKMRRDHHISFRRRA